MDVWPTGKQRYLVPINYGWCLWTSLYTTNDWVDIARVQSYHGYLCFQIRNWGSHGFLLLHLAEELLFIHLQPRQTPIYFPSLSPISASPSLQFILPKPETWNLRLGFKNTHKGTVLDVLSVDGKGSGFDFVLLLGYMMYLIQFNKNPKWDQADIAIVCCQSIHTTSISIYFIHEDTSTDSAKSNYGMSENIQKYSRKVRHGPGH